MSMTLSLGLTLGEQQYTAGQTYPVSLLPTVDGQMQIDGSGAISLTVFSPPAYAGGPYTNDVSNEATGILHTASVAIGPQSALSVSIARTSGASDVVGSEYTATPSLWLYDDPPLPTLAGEWYLDGVATGDTDLVYLTTAAGNLDYRESVSGSGATRTDTSNVISVAAAPDVTAPILSSPTGAKNGETGATTLGVTTDEGNGTLYWGIYPTASTPSAADVVAGTGATVSGSQAVSATGVQAVADQTGLTAATAYKAHYVHDDAAANRSAVATSAEFTTDAASGASFSDDFSSYPDASYLTDEDANTNYQWIDGGQKAKIRDVSGNKELYQEAANRNQGFKYIGQTFAADQYAEADIGSTFGSDWGDQAFIYLRYTDGNNFIRLEMVNGVVHNVSKRVAGTWTHNMATVNANTLATGKVIRFEITGGTFDVKIDGVSTLSAPVYHADLDTGGALASGQLFYQLWTTAGGFTDGVSFTRIGGGEL